MCYLLSMTCFILLAASSQLVLACPALQDGGIHCLMARPGLSRKTHGDCDCFIDFFLRARLVCGELQMNAWVRTLVVFDQRNSHDSCLCQQCQGMRCPSTCSRCAKIHVLVVHQFLCLEARSTFMMHRHFTDVARPCSSAVDSPPICS